MKCKKKKGKGFNKECFFEGTKGQDHVLSYTNTAAKTRRHMVWSKKDAIQMKKDILRTNEMKKKLKEKPLYLNVKITKKSKFKF